MYSDANKLTTKQAAEAEGSDPVLAMTRIPSRVRTMEESVGEDLTITAGTEASNAIPLTLQLVDADGATKAGARAVLVELFSAAMVAAVGALRLEVVSPTTATSTDGQARLLLSLDATGKATIKATDVSTSLAGTAYVRASIEGASKTGAFKALTFA